MIKIQNLHKTYRARKSLLLRGEEEAVFNGLNIEIPLNSFTAIIGLNGSGKTTLFKILSGYTSFDSGSILIKGNNYKDYLNNNKVFLVSSEDRSFYYRLTLIQNLKFFVTLFDINISQKDIDEKLIFLGLYEKKDHFYYELSTGMKQKLSLIRALLVKPDILILDEIERGVDKIMTEKIFNHLSNLKNTTIIYSTHQQHLIDKANYIIKLK